MPEQHGVIHLLNPSSGLCSCVLPRLPEVLDAAMEDSPLTLAHQHALHASTILSSSTYPSPPATLAAAASAHSLAATSFSAAAQLTRDPEALRTLELLAGEHERWAAKIKEQAERPIDKDGHGAGGLETVLEGDSGSSESSGKNGNKDSQASKSKPPVKDPPLPISLPFANTNTSHYPARLQKSTSSLATNLASARGIPSVPGTRVGSGTTSPNLRRSNIPSSERNQIFSASDLPFSSKPTTNPLNLLPPDESPYPSTTKNLARTTSSNSDAQDEPFSKFYSSLNTLISRIGSPFAASLAFAGLPVDDDEDDERDAQARAELLPRGWTEGRGRGRGLEKGWGTAEGGGGESFYVVPVSGGTLSYAGVVRRDSTGSSPPNEAAKSKPSVRRSRTYPAEIPTTTNSPDSSRTEIQAQLSGHSKTTEELVLENTGLRQTLDHMSRTMQNWQRKSKESENLLRGSIMALSKNTYGNGLDILSHVQRKSWMHVPYDEEKEEGDDEEIISEGRRVGEMEWDKEQKTGEGRVKELEHELETMKREIERINRENDKLKQMVGKFKERWDKLKEGARNKRASGVGGKLSKVEEGE